MIDKRKDTQVVVAVIFNKSGQVLLSTRPKGKSYAGYWEFVGGKTEQGETYFQALQREVSEELGLTIHQAVPWLKKNVVYEKVYLRLFFWRVYPEQWSGQVISKENQQWEWMEVGNLTHKKLLPNNYSFVNALLIPETFFLKNSVLYSSGEKIMIFPYRQATQKKQSIYITFRDVEHLGQLPNFEWIAIIVESQKQLRASLSAHALIWNIVSEQSFTELVEVLTIGQFIPILAINFSAQEQNKLRTLGIHGFIYSNDVTLV